MLGAVRYNAAMALEHFGRPRINWRWAAAVSLFLLAFVGLISGVSLSERPDVTGAGLLTKAYYSLGLFVVGETPEINPTKASRNSETAAAQRQLILCWPKCPSAALSCFRAAIAPRALPISAPTISAILSV